jgi:RNA polymerase sigma-70 factor (family 1)
LNALKPSESELIKALSKGEIKAFNDLFQIYGNRIFRFALGYLKSEPDAEELVQNVFLKVWERRIELKEDLSFKAYLFTIAFNIIRKHFTQKALTHKYIEQHIVNDSDVDTVHNIDYNSTKILIDRIVDQLPPKRKIVFIRNRIEGFTVKEIAQELGTSPKTVENQLGEALKFVREHLRKEHLGAIIYFILFCTI